MKAWWLPGKVPEIQPKELHARLSDGEQLQIVDVRTRREFRNGHISGASNVPIQLLPREWSQLGLDPTRPVVTICKTAHRSIPATQLLRNHGFTAMQLATGMGEWRRQGLPFESSLGGGVSRGEVGDDGVVAEVSERARKALLLVGVTIGMGALMVWSRRAFGARSARFAFVVVWLPLAWFAVLGRVLAGRPVLRLPAEVHALRAFERDGRVYELLGVRVAKWLLRRGPMAVFAPGLHLPAEPTPATVASLDERMRQAEALHEILLVVTLAIVVNAAVRGWWGAAGWTLLFNVLANGYPAMLQRYNRALLAQRFGLPSDQDSHRHRPDHD